jgi:hypothetical protein
MAKFYTNENFPKPAVEALRKLGHDVLTSLEAGNANQSTPDEEVLRFATQQERILLTLNRKHFIRLHEAKPEHSGIIACTLDINFSRLADQISSACQKNEPLQGKILLVNRPG